MLYTAIIVAFFSMADSDWVTVEAKFCCFRNTQGHAIASLFSDASHWLKSDKAVQSVKLPLRGELLSFTFDKVRRGSYAIAIVHDENDNGKLDMRWFPPGPAEGFGISNDATGSFGPPSFKDACFMANGDTKRNILIRY